MATELSFAKSFLTLLDTKPPKISPDHVEDPRTYPGHNPYILPRHPSQKPFSKPRRTSTTSPTHPFSSTAAPGSAPAVTVHLRSARNPPFALTLQGRDPTTTSAAELKEAVAADTGLPLDKIKLLYNKKPVADSKVLKDLVTDENVKEVEFGVMVLGGAAAMAAAAAAAGLKRKGEEEGKKEEEKQESVVAQGLSGKGVLETEEFWGDLKGFLQQRVRDEAVAGEACEVFRGAWKAR